ncbi:uncharacterized protein LOC132785483 [Drosophila nasuta]|uniref:uncharacterized protein LOC132785483 n=1 Tax=Drosophila nasuta TaxID=42062 RepID=UPI00295E77D6|nr:uncharacterized protein LOC132785483 [Drosophila nasuta]
MDRRKTSVKKSIKKSILRPSLVIKCNFVFDIIVTNFYTPQLKTDDKYKLSIGVQFNRKPIEITGNRINVNDFVNGTGTEFQINPYKLRQTIEECGMPVSVKYNGILIGSGQLLFPESFTENIAEDMTDLMHSDTCNFQKNGEVVGSIEFLLRLLIKCEENKGPSECRQFMGSCISPHDILFLVSESQKCPHPCDPCLDAWEQEEGDERINLDLLRYQTVKPPPSTAETLLYNPGLDAISCELKKMTTDCVSTIDTILKGTKRPTPPCRTADSLRGPCDGPCSQVEEQAAAPAVLNFSAPKMEVSVGDSKKNDIKPSRFCPGCLANMSWLPLFAACPKCGLKPSPVAGEEKPLKADNIILEYLGKQKQTVDDYCKLPCDKPEEKKKPEHVCRCTCKYGKICAYCRIREQCADFINLQQPATSPKVESEEEQVDYCAMEEKLEEKSSRPFLSRVFSELRDMYDIKDAVRPEDFEKITEQTRRKSTKPPLPFSAKARKSSITKKPKAKKVKKVAKEPNRLISSLHKSCAKKSRGVSQRHGWDWSSTREARKHGWRPGAVLKPIKKVMKYFLEYTPDQAPLAICKKMMQQAEEQERQLPTLNMCKKNGEIFVTLRAINTDNVKMKPIVFKIVKSDLAVTLQQIKRKLKDLGFSKCTCHQSLMLCVCRAPVEKKALEAALQMECHRRGMESCVEHLVLTDTSESDMEFDFDVTPPAAVARQLAEVKPRMNHSTQTLGKQDLKVKPLYPIQNDSFYNRTYDCALGDRYTGTAYGKLGEQVFEDGLFGYKQGGPHGEPANPGGRLRSNVIWGSKPGGPMQGGGRFGPQRNVGGKTFPGAPKKKQGQSKPIPVRMPQKFYKAAAAAAEAKKAEAEKSKQKKPTDMMEYMMKKGAVSRPWNPAANAY